MVPATTAPAQGLPEPALPLDEMERSQTNDDEESGEVMESHECEWCLEPTDPSDPFNGDLVQRHDGVHACWQCRETCELCGEFLDARGENAAAMDMDHDVPVGVHVRLWESPTMLSLHHPSCAASWILAAWIGDAWDGQYGYDVTERTREQIDEDVLHFYGMGVAA